LATRALVAGSTRNKRADWDRSSILSRSAKGVMEHLHLASNPRVVLQNVVSPARAWVLTKLCENLIDTYPSLRRKFREKFRDQRRAL
jgi:hypothetical protein